MSKLLNSKILLFIVGVALLALACLGGIATYAAIPAMLVIAYRFWLVRKRERNTRIERTAHTTLDHEMGGKRYLGAEVSLLSSRRLDLDTSPGPLVFEQLCVTKRGAMFTLRFDTVDGSASATNIRLLPVAPEKVSEWRRQEQIRQRHAAGKLELA